MRTPAGQAVRAAILLALGLATLAVVSQTVPDVDLWGHVTFGRDIVESGIIRQPDVYSFTADKEWINHEWLFEVAMATSYSALGPAGLILLRWTMVAALCWLVWNNARRQGASRESAILLVSIVALLTFTRTQHVRPQLASVVAFAAALSLLERASAGRLPAVMAIPPLMLVWANSHGGWLVGGGALGLWSAAQTLFGPSRRLGLIVGASAAAGLLATVVNPYGIGLWEFLGSTVGFGRPDITEWAPVTRAGWGMLAVWSVTAALAARAALRGSVPAMADRLLLLALAAASFRVSRLDAFFVIAAAMRCSAGSFVPGARVEGPADTPRMSVTARVAAGVAVAILLATVAPRRLACLDMAGASWLPEPAAAGYARAAQLHGRLFSYFDWGEYAIWHHSLACRCRWTAGAKPSIRCARWKDTSRRTTASPAGWTTSGMSRRTTCGCRARHRCPRPYARRAGRCCGPAPAPRCWRAPAPRRPPFLRRRSRRGKPEGVAFRVRERTVDGRRRTSRARVHVALRECERISGIQVSTRPHTG